MSETTVIKNESKDNSSPHRHFTEHITDVLEEPQCESDKDQDTSGFLIRLPPYNNPQATPAKIATQDHSNSRKQDRSQEQTKRPNKVPGVKTRNQR
jgi:hypothetical protein